MRYTCFFNNNLILKDDKASSILMRSDIYLPPRYQHNSELSLGLNLELEEKQ
jgi:hypothetical protein